MIPAMIKISNNNGPKPPQWSPVSVSVRGCGAIAPDSMDTYCTSCALASDLGQCIAFRHDHKFNLIITEYRGRRKEQNREELERDAKDSGSPLHKPL